MRQLWGAILFTVLISITSEAQTVRNVPGTYSTIQAAIVAAQSGDTVRVAPGVYVENINFLGKAITVVSIAGADVTTIDGNQVGAVVTIASGEGLSSVLDGFTIRNGKGSFSVGGGIQITGSPTIRRNRIVNNSSCGGAVGISIISGSPIIQGNFISSNANVLGCSGGHGGGGVFIGEGSAQILENTISNNSVTNSSGNGGGISVDSTGPVLIRGNIITGNSGAAGGGISISGKNTTVLQNLIAGNSAGNGGGIAWVAFTGANFTVTNNTIVDNSANVQGSAIYAERANGPTLVKNNIIIGKSLKFAIHCTIIGTNPPIFEFNDVFVDQASAYGGTCTDVTGTNGNISVAPLFVDSAAQNYRLLLGSAGIDAGTNAAVGFSTDLDSFPRILPIAGTVDMGAYELAAPTTSTVSATSLVFTDQTAGTVSAPRNLTLTNTGTTPLVVGSVTVTGEFSQTNTCQTLAGIPAGQSCTISVRFNPSAGGPRLGQLTIASNSNSSNAVNLSGNGVGPLALSGNPLTFIDQRTGTTSPATALSLSNTSATNLNISSITTVGDFTSSNDCPAAMAGGSACTVSIRFAPTARGMRFGAITINAGGSLYIVTLSGRGVAPLISLSSTFINFGSQTIGSTSASQSVILSNPGDVALAINSITGQGLSDFSFTSDCGSTLGVNASCSISMVFSPTVAGLKSLTISISDDAVGSPHTILLNGSGVGALLTATPTSLAFGNQSLYLASPSKLITLRNAGTVSMTVSSVVTSGDFSKSGSCTSLAANATCTLQLTFTPTAAGPRAGALTVTNSSLGSPLVVPLSGTGLETVVYSAASLTFAADLVGTTSPTQIITVTNAKSVPLTFSGITTSGDFFKTTTCGTTLPAGISCTISVAFSPTVSGIRSGSVTIAIDGVSGDQIINLSGTGLDTLPAPVITAISPNSRAVGATGTTVAVSGTGFSSLSVLRWGGANRPTTFVNNTTLTMALSANDFSTTGTFPVSVFNPAPGGGLSSDTDFVVYLAKTLTTKDLIYDRTGNQIYASVPGSAPILGNTLSTMDPANGNFGISTSIGSEPGKLAISDDSHTIYVALDGAAQIRPFDTVSQTPGAAFSLGSDSSNGAKFAEDIAVAPGSSQTIAVSRKYANVGPRAAGVAIYDNGVKRAVETADHIGSNVIEFSASSSILYGYDAESTPAGFRTMSVNSSGVAITNVVSNLIPSGSVDFQFAGGRVYSFAGQVINPVSGTLVGTFSLPTGGQVRGLTVDTTLQRAFILYASTSSVRILAYDLNTFGTTGSVTLPAQGTVANIGSLIRWGGNGLAFRSGTQVFTLQIPQSWLPPPAFVFALNPGMGTQGQNNLDIAVTGQLSNFIQDQTTADFGAGITVNQVTVADTTHATANISIAAGADVGPRSVTITSGTMTAQQSNAFSVAQALMQLTGMFPFAGAPGTTLSATFSGNFFAGPLNVNMGSGISVSNVQISGPNLVTATLTIASDATLGNRSVTFSNTSGNSSNALNFSVSALSVAVSKIGTGSGTVTSSLAGINCGSTCSALFAAGDVVALTAAPSAGSIFSGWSGDTDCLDGSVTISVARNCIARFELPQSNLRRLRGDFNADGKSDVLWQNTDGSSAIWLIDGLGVIGGAGLFGSGTGWSVQQRGDFNADGMTDVVWQHTNGSAAIWLINGLSVISSGDLIGSGTSWSINQVGDFNGDGKSDVVWQHSDGSTAIWLMDGLSVISGGGLIGPGTGWSVKQIGDFNGDAKNDIVWQHTDGSAAIWLMNGLSVISGGGLIGSGSGWSVKQIGDFNGDAKSDIVWQHTDGSAAIWLMDGLGVINGSGLIGPGTGWSVKQIGDFNGDGKSDIVWQHTDGSAAIWLMNGLSVISGSGLIGPGTGWSVKQIGDFNGDGKGDIVWQHTDGSAAIWLMDGLTVVSGGGLLGSGTGWSLAP